MKNRYIIIFLVVLIISNIFLIISNYKKYDYIFFGTHTILEYKDEQLIGIKEYKKVNNKLNYKIFNVYNDTKIDKYYLNINNDGSIPGYDIYSLDNEQINLSNSLLAYTDGIEIKILKNIKSNEIKEADKFIFKEIFKQYDLSENYNLFMEKIECDIDNDGSLEKIYSINNYGLSNEKIYCFTFLVESDDKFIMIDKIIDKPENVQNVDRKNLSWVIDLDNDNKYEIVLMKNSGDNTITYYEFYKYDDKSNKITKMK